MCQFLFESSEGIFERPEKFVWTEHVSRSFWAQCVFILAYLKVFQTNQMYKLEPEFCPVSEYGFRNFVSIFCSRAMKKSLKSLKN